MWCTLRSTVSASTVDHLQQHARHAISGPVITPAQGNKTVLWPLGPMPLTHPLYISQHSKCRQPHRRDLASIIGLSLSCSNVPSQPPDPAHHPLYLPNASTGPRGLGSTPRKQCSMLGLSSACSEDTPLLLQPLSY